MEWRRPLTDAISEVLETMCFTPVECDEGNGAPGPGAEEGPRRVSIGMRSARGRAEISLTLREPLLREVTARLLGRGAAAVSPEDMLDAAREILNMTGGVFLARANREDWELGIPRSGGLGGPPAGTVAFTSLGEPAGVAAYREEALP